MYFSKNFRGFHLWPCGIIVSRSELRQDLMTKALKKGPGKNIHFKDIPLNDLFSPNRFYLIFITSHQIMTLPIISSLMKLDSTWDNHLPKPASEHCFMGTRVSTYESLEKHFHTQLWWLALIFIWHYLEITLKESLKEGWSMLGWRVGMSGGGGTALTQLTDEEKSSLRKGF